MKKLFHILAFHLLSYVSSQKSQEAQSSFISIIPVNQQKLRTSSSNEINVERSVEIIERHFIDLSQILSLDTHEQINEILVQLVEGDEPILFTRQFSTNDNGGYFWYGENDVEEASNLSFQVHDDKCIGNAMIRSKYYSFETLIDDASYSPNVAVLSEVEYSNFPIEVDEDETVEDIDYDEIEHSRKLRSSEPLIIGKDHYEIISKEMTYEHRALQSLADNGQSIDVLCLYTAQALQARCNASKGKNCSKEKKYLSYVDSMNEQCQLAVHQTTTSYQLSGVSTSINLVHSQLVNQDYVEDDNICAIKNKMRTGSSSHPVYREIQALREQYNADLVGLIVSNRATTCGCGSQPYSWYYDTSDFAYFTTTDECATNNLSFAHEIGHSFGCFHNSGHAYANGYRDPNERFRTIMSYQCNGTNCPRVMRVSSSDNGIKYQNRLVGDESHDNARQINLRKYKVANYRSSVGGLKSNPTVTPTVAPTIAPSKASRPSGQSDIQCKWYESLIEIYIQTDNKPQETSWELRKQNIIIHQSEKYTALNTLVKQQVCITAGGCYDFIIEDSGSNGISNGGNIKIYEADKLVLDQPTFTTSRRSYSIPVEGTRQYKIGYSTNDKHPCQWLSTTDMSKQRQECAKAYIKEVCPGVCKTCTSPSRDTPVTFATTPPTSTTPTCKWDESLLKIELKTDNNPEQLSWELTQSNGELVETMSEYSRPNTLSTFQKCVMAASCYNFIIKDKGNDGLSHGSYFKIIESGQTVYETSNFNTSQQEVSFGVDGNMKHRIGYSKLKRYKCRWLRYQTASKRNKECGKPYISGVCPQLCNSCG